MKSDDAQTAEKALGCAGSDIVQAHEPRLIESPQDDEKGKQHCEVLRKTTSAIGRIERPEVVLLLASL
jgi:hypothetical protein